MLLHQSQRNTEAWFTADLRLSQLWQWNQRKGQDTIKELHEMVGENKRLGGWNSDCFQEVAEVQTEVRNREEAPRS